MALPLHRRIRWRPMPVIASCARAVMPLTRRWQWRRRWRWSSPIRLAWAAADCGCYIALPISARSCSTPARRHQRRRQPRCFWARMAGLLRRQRIVVGARRRYPVCRRGWCISRVITAACHWRRPWRRRSLWRATVLQLIRVLRALHRCVSGCCARVMARRFFSLMIVRLRPACACGSRILPARWS